MSGAPTGAVPEGNEAFTSVNDEDVALVASAFAVSGPVGYILSEVDLMLACIVHGERVSAFSTTADYAGDVAVAVELLLQQRVVGECT